MNFEQLLGRQLEEALPLQREEGRDWEDVLDRAGFPRRRPRRLLAIAAVLVVLGVPSAYAVAPRLLGLAAPVGAAELAVRDVRIVGGSAEQRALLREIVVGLRPASLSRVDVASVRGRVVLAVAAGGGLRGRWEEAVVAGAFARRSAELGLPRVVTVTTGLGRRPAAVASRAGSAPDRDDVLARVETLARRAGAEVEEVELGQPDGLALAARLRVRDPMRFANQGVVRLLRGLGGTPLDGLLLQVVDDRGEAVLDYASARDAGSTSQVYRSELVRCFDAGLPRSPASAPRCPVEY